ncbi:hypothetical protein AVEN_7016-1 [Araneus ventricosus]|uniref:Uncharacterized protein n=1 Tax=Araneus ventricosus TaxID=182803 RepID=A0A4Y2IDN7_ARAVE|nr:hypothetical protein AVEN_7016-1 [Araneus ventricosus]
MLFYDICNIIFLLVLRLLWLRGRLPVWRPESRSLVTLFQDGPSCLWPWCIPNQSKVRWPPAYIVWRRVTARLSSSSSDVTVQNDEVHPKINLVLLQNKR